MPEIQRASDAETDFMTELLRSMDDIPQPTPHPQPARNPRTPSKPVLPCKNHVHSESTLKKQQSAFPVTSRQGKENVDLQQALRDAEDWDWDTEDYVLSPPRKSMAKPAVTPIFPVMNRAQPLQEFRCIVNEVIAEYTPKYAKLLHVTAESKSEQRTVFLQDSWANTEVQRGDVINVIGSFEHADGHCPTIKITDKENVLILHPDVLLTATAISTASQCLRRPMISAMLHSTSGITPSLVWGNMLHEIMQACLQSRNWEDSFINECIDDAIQRGYSDLFQIKITPDEAKAELQKRASGLHMFSQKYINAKPHPDARLTDSRNSKVESFLSINDLLAVEEDIWSPSYGLRGKIDATVQVTILEREASKASQSSWIMPLELKTGRSISSLEHRAQTMLYTLLLAQRYGVAVPSGLLYYTQGNEVIRVPAVWNEVRSLLMLRNEMACYMIKRPLEDRDVTSHSALRRPRLPPTIDNKHVCSRCYVADACMLYQLAIDDIEDIRVSHQDVAAAKMHELTPNHLSFFAKWESLITFEEQNMQKLKKELWTMGSDERERKGRCLSNMIMDMSYRPPNSPRRVSRETKIHRFTYKFIRQTSKHTGNTSLNGQIMTGEPVLVSVEPRLLALARGFVVELSHDFVVIGVDRPLTRESLSKHCPELFQDGPVVFRIDKDEMTGGMTRIRANLAQLFYGTDKDSRCRRLIVDLEPPEFEMPDLSNLIFSDTLNINQQEAIVKTLSAKDYALVLGMPGTGKTTTIAEIIQILVARGNTVLLTSYTHSAVDTILRKLRGKTSYAILRLGNQDKIHPDVHEFTVDHWDTSLTAESYEKSLLLPPLVATTCLSIDHAMFSRRTFDYCIVDEASQVTLPTCIGPLRLAQKFILVGDHFQLPPLVRSQRAREGGLDVSLFRRLADAHPQAVVDLIYQYRMNKDIMLLSNKLVYEDRLKCGSQSVAEQTLTFPLQSRLECDQVTCWLRRLMHPNSRAVFVDTDAMPAQESRIGDLLQNESEAHIVSQITRAFVDAGVEQEQIGIVSFYRQQVKLLSSALLQYEQIEILTADRSQGRDKDCIIISLVRSNSTKQIGDLLKDWRRINVAFTRAKKKLVIVGSRKTLDSAPLLQDFCAIMEQHNWILSLPASPCHINNGIDVGLTTRGPRKRCESLISSQTHNISCSPTSKRARVHGGLLRNRPILRDVVNNTYS